MNTRDAPRARSILSARPRSDTACCEEHPAPVVRRSAAAPSASGLRNLHQALVEVARRETATYLPLAAVAARHPELNFERDR